MKLKMSRLEFVNAGPFEKFEVDLEPGAIGVMGPNGSGKTSFLRLWYAAMTGKFDLFPHVKEKVIYDGIAEGQPTYIRCCFYAGLDFYDITRYLDSSSAASQVMRITYADQTNAVIRGTANIEAQMRKLGLTAPMLRSAVFQERPAWVVESTDSGRADLLKALCQTEPCDKVIAAMKRALNESPLTTVIAPNPEDSPEALYRQSEERAVQLQGEVGQFETQLMPADLAERIAKSISTKSANVATTDRIKTLESEIPALDQKISLLNSTVGSLAATIESSKIIVSKLAERAQQAKNAVNQFDSWQATKTTKDTQQKRIDSLLRPIPEVPVPDQLEKLKELAEKVGEFSAEHARLQKQLSALVNEDNCPTCEQPLPDPETFKQNLRVSITTAFKTVAKAGAAKLAVDKYNAAVLARNQQEQKRQSDLANARSIIKNLPVIPEDLGDVSDEHVHITRYESAAKNLTASDKQLSDADADLRSAKTLRDEKNKELANLKTKLVSIETFTAAQVNAFNQHVNAKTLLPSRRQELTRAQAQKEDMAARVQQYRQRKDKAAKSQKIRTRFEGIIEKLGREHLQKMVVSQFQRKMETALVDGLERFGNPFQLRLLDNLEMETTDANGTPRLVKALSTGQRAVAAVVFWRAVAAVFGSGVLVLDEPTANMDPANIRYLREAFSAFTAELADDQQLVVITHSEDLRPAFSQIIDFGVKQGEESGSD